MKTGRQDHSSLLFIGWWRLDSHRQRSDNLLYHLLKLVCYFTSISFMYERKARLRIYNLWTHVLNVQVWVWAYRNMSSLLWKGFSGFEEEIWTLRMSFSASLTSLYLLITILLLGKLSDIIWEQEVGIFEIHDLYFLTLFPSRVSDSIAENNP